MSDKNIKKLEQKTLLGLADTVNSGAIESMTDVLGSMINVGACPHCKSKIEAGLGSHPWQVGICPDCDKTIFYVNVPFCACGSIGPLCMGWRDGPFYFNKEHLGDRFVEIHKSADNEQR